jgi:L-fuconolactonase
MNRIDAHQHFWKYDPSRHGWLTDEMNIIRRDFLPHDLQLLLQQNSFDGCVVVQVDQTEEETNFLIELAAKNNFIKGVIGWVDFKAENIEERLNYYSSFKIVKGFRHILQAEKDRSYMLDKKFMKGVSLLQKFNFTYDLLIYTDQLKYIRDFVSVFPDQKFVIDHLAKPEIKNKNLHEWEKEIRAIAQFENVYCKISGMVTEADWKYWKEDDFTPFLDVATEAFGINRLMFGSDWPVCLVAASYPEVVNIVTKYFSTFSKTDQDKLFGGNAIQFYNLV